MEDACKVVDSVEVKLSSQEVEVLVVGAGQAGIAMSEHLGAHGVPHLVVERDRIAERWRSWRWDSLVANGPAWHDRFPGLEFDVPPDAGRLAGLDIRSLLLCRSAPVAEARPCRRG